MPVLELIIFAGLAGVVLFQLYSVLGRRVGRQPEDAAAEAVAQKADKPVANEDAPMIEDEGVQLSGLSAIKARDVSFDLNRFLGGSRGAYEMIVRAYAQGDRKLLGNLLAPNVLASFEGEITRREAEDRTEVVEFLNGPRADFEAADLQGDTARLTVRFLAEIRGRTKGPEGETVEDRRTAELWTFERNLKSKDPNWTLVHVDAAQA